MRVTRAGLAVAMGALVLAWAVAVLLALASVGAL